MTGVLADERMSDVDALVWNVEHAPRNRTTIATLARFAAPLDPVELRHRVDRASRVLPRLRQRVVIDPRATVAPRWSIDPDFRVSFHLRPLRLDGGDERRLADLVRTLLIQPFDRARPLWEFTHITGLDDGGEALLLKSHHAVSDGVGGVEMMLELFDLDAEAERTPLPPPIEPDDGAAPPSPNDELVAALAGLRTVLDTIAGPRSLAEIVEEARGVDEVLGSAARMFRPRPAAGVPSARSDDLEARFFSVPLDELRAAGRRVDGTINDAFVSAVAIGIGLHFDSGSSAPLRVSVPLNTREGDAVGGNHWTPGRIDVDLRLADDSGALMTDVRCAMRRTRAEPGHLLMGPIASGLRRLPAPVTAAAFTSFSAALDVAASNVPGSPVPLHLCGRPVEAMIPFGPLSGCAVNVTLLSHAGTAHIGVVSDPAAVSDADVLLCDLRRGFDRVMENAR